MLIDVGEGVEPSGLLQSSQVAIVGARSRDLASFHNKGANMIPQKSDSEFNNLVSGNSAGRSATSLTRYEEGRYRPWLLLIIILVLVSAIAGFALARQPHQNKRHAQAQAQFKRQSQYQVFSLPSLGGTV